MEARRRTWFDDRGLAIGGDRPRGLPVYAGAMHYWRVDPGRWKACLSAMHAQGFTVVETYVPWRVHEPAPGEYDWQGPADLRRFLDTAQAAGLAVVVRPGPHCNAELTCFGMPDFIVGDPLYQAKTSRGTPVWLPSPPRAWPVPSYASAAFRQRVHGWYAAVAEQIRDHLAPEGPVVAIGVDNEAQMFFRLGAFDHDYHPDAIAWFREQGYDDAPKQWAPDDAARCAAWVRFKDTYIARALGDFAGMLDDVGLGEVARFHNLPPGHQALYDLRGIQTAIEGPVGIDAYTARTGFRDLRRRGLALVGNASPVPLALEVGVGFFPWFPPLDDHDTHRERDHLVTLLACGARGFNLYMAVDRERWYGGAISPSGTLEKHASWIKPLISALEDIDWPRLRRATPIALIDTRADHRFGLATSFVDPLTPVLSEVLDFGPGGAAELGSDPGAVASRRWQTAIASALELAQVPYAIVEESASEEELARFAAVIAPTIERVDRALWEKLRALAEAKQTVVVIGPGTPTRDELDRPLAEPIRRAGKLKEGSLDDLPGLAADLGALAHIDDAWQIDRPDDVRCHAFGDGERVRAVFLMSDSAKPTTAHLLAGPARALRDVFSGERFAIASGRASIAMPARGVRMLLVD